MATDQLSLVFNALADPTRRAILRRLEHGAAAVGELAQPFEISQPAVSKHLKVLERAGLISRHDHKTSRLSVLEADAMAEAARYVEHYKKLWTEGFDRLDEELAAYTRGVEEGTNNG